MACDWLCTRVYAYVRYGYVFITLHETNANNGLFVRPLYLGNKIVFAINVRPFALAGNVIECTVSGVIVRVL